MQNQQFLSLFDKIGQLRSSAVVYLKVAVAPVMHMDPSCHRIDLHEGVFEKVFLEVSVACHILVANVGLWDCSICLKGAACWIAATQGV